ncbi:MAG: class I adenylate-forming enzyme family protein [Pseudorhodoplanes sp.]
MAFTDVLERHANDRPAQSAIVDGSRIITYRELDRAVSTVTANLAASGIKSHDVVAVVMPDSAKYLIAILGLARIGAVMVGIDGELPPPEKSLAASQAGAIAVIVETTADAIAGLPAILFSELRRSTSGAFRPPALGPDHPLTVVQSSGTTGAPKSFFWSHRAMELQAIRHRNAFGWTANDRYLAVVAMKFFWERELCFVFLYLGATIVVNRAVRLDELANAVRTQGITVMALTPVHLNGLLAVPALEWPAFPSLRTLVVGSAPLSNERRLRVREQLTPNFYEQLGANEAGLLVLGTPSDQDARPDAIGRIAPGVEAQVVDSDGRALPDGVVGLAGFRGECFPTEYLGNAEATARSFREGWFYPGDLAAIDEEGYFHFKGRADDVINFQGVKFYPIEVERALLAHPAVAEAAVIGAPDDSNGEIPVAFIVVAHPVTADELQHFCAQRIAAYKAPERFVFIGQLPRNRTGKILKRRLKELYLDLLARNAGATARAAGGSAAPG